MIRSRAMAIAALSTALACGYTQGFGGRSLGIASVAIAAVQNESFRQDLDRLLTIQLGRDLTEYTGLVPATYSQADAVLKVTIKEASTRSISESTGGAIEEGAFLLAAGVELVSRSTGKTIYTNKHADQAEFRVPVFETLETARAEAIADLSRRILLAIAR
jgi:hypothetical protein